jgi:sulfite exporter TauE/SafE
MASQLENTRNLFKKTPPSITRSEITNLKTIQIFYNGGRISNYAGLGSFLNKNYGLSRKFKSGVSSESKTEILKLTKQLLNIE